MRTHILLAAVMASIPALSACDGDGATGGQGGGAGGGGAGGGGGGGGGALFAGIPDCADIFMKDGVCQPSLALCPKGQIPKFDEGCVPVGISSCAPDFLEEDGLCHPSMDKCPDGTFVVPSEGCVPIDGAGCGSGTWGDIPDDPVNVYVDPAHSGGDGDGSKAKPFTTIAEALAVAGDGDRVALAAGTYDEPAILTSGVDLVGRCPSMVRVQGTGKLGALDVVVGVKDVATPSSIRRISVGGNGIGIRIEDSQVAVDEVWIDGATTAALSAAVNPQLTASRLLIENTQPDAAGASGEGILVSGGDVSISKTTVRNVHLRALGVLTGLGTELKVDDSLFEDVLPDAATGLPSYGFTFDAGVVEMANTAIVGPQIGGTIFAGAAVTATHVLVADVFDTVYGNGLYVESESSLALTGSAFVHNAGPSLLAGGLGTEIDSRGNLFAFGGGVDGVEGHGIALHQGAKIVSRDDAVVGNEGLGVLAYDAGTKITMAGTLVEANEAPGHELAQGRGVTMRRGAEAELDRVAIVGNRFAGIFATGEDEGVLTPLTVLRSLVAGTLPSADGGNNGVGIQGARNAKLTVEKTLVWRSVAGGIVLQEGEASIVDSIVRDVQEGKLGTPDSRVFGEGVADGVIAHGQTGPATLSMTGTLVEGCARAGILFQDASGSVAGSRSTGNLFGLVTQGAPTPAVQGDNDFSGNDERDVVENGTLPLP